MITAFTCSITGLTVEVINPKLPNILWSIPHPLSIHSNAVTYLRHCLRNHWLSADQKPYVAGALLTLLVKKQLILDKTPAHLRRQTLERVSMRALLHLSSYILHTSEITQQSWPFLSLDEQNPSAVYNYLRIISGEEMRLEQKKSKKELQELFEILEDDTTTSEEETPKTVVHQKKPQQQQQETKPVKEKMKAHLNTLDDALFGNMPTSLTIAEILARKKGQ